MLEGIIECIPNFSEGRDKAKVKQIVDAIASNEGVKVLHVDMGYDVNRTVITFAGIPEACEKAAFDAIAMASQVIDMRKQKGTHPRLGACDVMPMVPVSGISIEELKETSYRLSQRVADELNIPIYNYEYSAREDKRKRLEVIRQGEYEGLEEKMQQAGWQPDYGDAYNPKAGATVLGARHFLLAYNVNLDTRDVAVAKKIAALIRESGQVIDGVRQPGCFAGVKAIGWDVPEYDMVQVSTNITNTDEIGMHQVYEKIKELAKDEGIKVKGSELIGLTPKRCILEVGRYYSNDHLETCLIKSAVEHLGLDSVVPFLPQERIIEYLL